MIDSPTRSYISIDQLDGTDSPVAQLMAVLARRSFARTPWNRTAPWRIEQRNGLIEVRLAEAHEERLTDGANRELLVACGALVETVRIVASGLGYALSVDWIPLVDEDVIARLRVDGCTSSRHEDRTLLRQIVADSAHRLTSDASDHSPAFSPALTAVLRHAARSGGAWLDVIADDARRELLADLELEATIIADAERSARRLVTMEHSARGHEAPLFVEGGRARLGELMSLLGAKVLVRHDWFSGRASRVRTAAAEAPLLAVLGTHSDSPREWLAAGRALQRVLLHAAVQGLRATFLNEPLDHPLIRDALRSVLFADGVAHAIVRFEFDTASGGELR